MLRNTTEWNGLLHLCTPPSQLYKISVSSSKFNRVSSILATFLFLRVEMFPLYSQSIVFSLTTRLEILFFAVPFYEKEIRKFSRGDIGFQMHPYGIYEWQFCIRRLLIRRLDARLHLVSSGSPPCQCCRNSPFCDFLHHTVVAPDVFQGSENSPLPTR